MGVEKEFNPRSGKAGQPLATASSGITWATPSRPRTIEYKTGEIRRTRIIVPSFTFTTTAASKAIGQQIYQLPEGFILPLAVNLRMVSTTGATTTGTAGEVGIGTTVATGATNALGTAAWSNVLGPEALANHVAQTALTTQVAGAAGNTAGAMDVIDSTDSTDPVELYLNIASAYSGTGGVTVSEAIVDLLWINLGDKI